MVAMVITGQRYPRVKGERVSQPRGARHYKQRFVSGQPAPDFSVRDAAYRAALGLGQDDPLPASLGQVDGHASDPHARLGVSVLGQAVA